MSRFVINGFRKFDFFSWHKISMIVLIRCFFFTSNLLFSFVDYYLFIYFMYWVSKANWFLESENEFSVSSCVWALRIRTFILQILKSMVLQLGTIFMKSIIWHLERNISFILQKIIHKFFRSIIILYLTIQSFKWTLDTWLHHLISECILRYILLVQELSVWQSTEEFDQILFRKPRFSRWGKGKECWL